MATVGFIGLGQMGSGMSRNIMKGGHDLQVFDLNAETVAAVAADGAKACATAAEAGDGADFVVTSLPIGANVEAAMFGEDSAAAAMPKGSILIDMSTISPEETKKISARLQSMGLSMVDAPVGRSSAHAKEGKSVFMVGGEKDDVARAEPILMCMGEAVTHCGPVGAGALLKLVNNYMSAMINLVTAEGMTLALRGGIDQDVAYEVLSKTPAGCGQLTTLWPNLALKDVIDPVFMLDLAHKDLGLALEVGSQYNVPLTSGGAGHAIYGIARTQGRGRHDWTTAMYHTVRKLSGEDNI